MTRGFAIIVDIGKTLSKVSLWSRDGEMLDRKVRPNLRVRDGGQLRLDAEGISQWLLDALASFSDEPVEFIVPVAHGAAVAAMVDEQLAFAPLDYEQTPPTEIVEAYQAERDPFQETGSPTLPDCLNMGMQLFWLDRLHPEAMANATLLPWAQYWAAFLSGTSVSEVTSLGCHTDLWRPAEGTYSKLAVERGWSKTFAPLAKADDIIGYLRPEIAAQTGLSQQVRVLAGLHDSNAALQAARAFARIDCSEATVLSTGTWFVAMRLAQSGLDLANLSEERDCLVNVDVRGQPVPSARFMGGREIETLIEIDTRRVDITPDQPALLAALPEVVAAQAMVLPTLAPGCGPFPRAPGGWIDRPIDPFARRAAACVYAALVAETSLELIGSTEVLLVEGRFADAEVFVRALASRRADMEVYVANSHNDVSFGALRLLVPALKPEGELRRIEPLECDLSAYRREWLSHVQAIA